MFDATLKSGRLGDYESRADIRERHLVAQLVSAYAEWPGLGADHVVFLSGAQEGISLVYGWAARVGLSTVLPLPWYYSFEQSARRYGVPVAAYVSADGTVRGDVPRRRLDVRVIPNSVTGTVFPSAHPCNGATLIDAVFQVGEHRRPGMLREALLDELRHSDPDSRVLVFTASKICRCRAFDLLCS